jgi:serine/threonine protein phosphatase PrpC
MKIIIQSYSTIGTRSSNEDAIDIVNNLDNANISNIPILYIGVFDGHGGGDISKILVDKNKINIGKYFCNISSPIASKLSISKKFNNKMIIPLFNRIQEKLKNYYIKSNTMGSTALIGLIYKYNSNQINQSDKFNLKIINLGDSRAIIYNEYNISNQLSLDHKPHLLCEKKRIDHMGGTLEYSEGDDPRINGMSVSRSFGDLDNSFICQVPDIYDYIIRQDKFIILGCDGIWDVLQNQEVGDFILEKYDELKSQNKNLVNLKANSENNLAQKLADYAIEKGSNDNISIIIIFFIDNL